MKIIPPRQFIIIGKANTGKTLFMLNFAEYLGCKNLIIKFKSDIGESTKSGTVDYFKNVLVRNMPSTTRCLQILGTESPVLIGKRRVAFIDTTGLSSSINPEQEVRNGMLQTLLLLKEDYIILHMIDAVSVAFEKKVDDIDQEINRYGRRKGNYIILANKSDLRCFNDGIKIINGTIKGTNMIKTSALNKTGFDEVRKHMLKLLKQNKNGNLRNILGIADPE